jgi:hypothetical protein
MPKKLAGIVIGEAVRELIGKFGIASTSAPNDAKSPSSMNVMVAPPS